MALDALNQDDPKEARHDVRKIKLIENSLFLYIFYFQRLDCVTIYASPDGNIAFNMVLENALCDTLKKHPRFGQIFIFVRFPKYFVYYQKR